MIRGSFPKPVLNVLNNNQHAYNTYTTIANSEKQYGIDDVLTELILSLFLENMRLSSELMTDDEDE